LKDDGLKNTVHDFVDLMDIFDDGELFDIGDD